MKDFYTRNEYVSLKTDYLNKIVYLNDDEFDGDEYEINVKHTGEIVIYANNERGRNYALESLEEFISGDKVLICTLHDKPSFILRGIIEGFYGKPYTKKERLDIIDFCVRTKLNTYFYAPKDDLYHRINWRDLYPEVELNNLKDLIDYAKERNIDFYYCIAPGNDFDYCLEEDYEKFFKKIKQIMDLGVNKFALLMDDIPLKLTDEQAKRFETVGNAHAYLSNVMYDYLRNELKDFNLLMCPTDYFQLGETPYRTDLMKSIYSEIGIFWTGYNTVSEKIDERQARKINKVLGKNLYLWDNYPVNDFWCKERVYLGAISNRSVNLCNYHMGYVCNPAWLWNLSKIPLHTMAQYAYDSSSYYEQDALKNAIEDLIEEDYQNAFELLCWYSSSGVIEENHFDIVMSQLYKEKNFKVLDKIYKEMEYVSRKLRTYPDKDMLEELTPLLDYMDLEVSLYKGLKKHKIDPEIIKKMTSLVARTSNQEILRYIKDNNLGDFEIELTEKRMNYWRYLDEEKL